MIEIFRDRRGFTLAEIIFVVALLAIIIGIVVVTYPQIISRMQVKSDRVSAMNLAKVLRGWYEDGMSDVQRRDSIESFVDDNMKNRTTKLSSLESMGIDVFIDSTYKPNSLKNSVGSGLDDKQEFYVGVVGEGKDMRFVVAVESDTEGGRLGEIDSTNIADYDGTKSAIIYVER